MTDDDPPARAFVDLQVTIEDDDGNVLKEMESPGIAGVDVEIPVNKRLQTAKVSVDVTDVEVVPTDEDGEAVRARTPQTSTDAREALVNREDGGEDGGSD